jgi:Fic family protein
MVNMHARMPTMRIQEFQAPAAAQMLYKKGVEQDDFFAPVCPEQHVNSSLHNLLTYYNNHERTADPPRMATLLEILIKWIHPFHDGNGRTARAFALAYIDRHTRRPVNRIASGVERTIDNVLKKYETLNDGLTSHLCDQIMTNFETGDLYYNSGFSTTHWSN